jgi:hypothetical protein
MRRAIVTAASVAISFIVLNGCDKTKTIPQVDATIQVTYADGQPVTDLILILNPQQGDIERPQPTVLDKSGKCTIHCPVGNYRASLTSPPVVAHKGEAGGPVGSATTVPTKATIPQEYFSARSSPWLLTISEADHDQKLAIRSAK